MVACSNKIPAIETSCTSSSSPLPGVGGWEPITLFFNHAIVLAVMVPVLTLSWDLEMCVVLLMYKSIVTEESKHFRSLPTENRDL